MKMPYLYINDKVTPFLSLCLFGEMFTQSRSPMYRANQLISAGFNTGTNTRGTNK